MASYNKFHVLDDVNHNPVVTGWQKQQDGRIWATLHLEGIEKGDLIMTTNGRYRVIVVEYLKHSSGNLCSAVLEVVS